jgi:hypothetical protein
MSDNDKRYNRTRGQKEEAPEVEEFLEDLFDLYDKHGLAIAHEDRHGSFIVKEDDQELRSWMEGASFEKGEEPSIGDRVLVTDPYGHYEEFAGQSGTVVGFKSALIWIIDLDDGPTEVIWEESLKIIDQPDNPDVDPVDSGDFDLDNPYKEKEDLSIGDRVQVNDPFVEDGRHGEEGEIVEVDEDEMGVEVFMVEFDDGKEKFYDMSLEKMKGEDE